MSAVDTLDSLVLQTKGKAAIDVVCNPLGKSGGSLIQQVMIVSFGSLATSTPYLGAILLVIVLTWMAAANSLSKQARPHSFLMRFSNNKEAQAIIGQSDWTLSIWVSVKPETLTIPIRSCSRRGLAEHLPLHRVPEHMFWCWCLITQKETVTEEMFLGWFKHRNRVPEHVFLCWCWLNARN